MSREIIRKEIDQIMETIAEQWDIIRAYEGKIPLIEMDIFMNNLRKLYEDICLIDKMNKAPGFDTGRIKAQITRESSILFEPEVKTKSADTENTLAEKPPVEEKPELPDIPAAEDATEEPEPAQEATAEQAQEKQETEMVKKEASENEDENTEPVSPATEIDTSGHTEKDEQFFSPSPQKATDLFGTPSPTLADKYQTEKKSIKDQLAADGKDNSIGNRMRQSQIGSLKTAIGINEKFLFINELFKGDLAGYNRAIELLNECGSQQEALAKLEEMRQQFNWSELSGSFLRLSDFLRRRYNA